MTCATDRRLTRGSLPAVLAAMLAVVVGVVGTPAAVFATDVATDLATDFPPLVPPSLSHRSQFGLAVLPGSGFRVLIPYGENVYCGQPNERVCSGRLPFFLDVQPSYGLGPHLDVLVDLRFGLEADFARTHQFAIVPGFRYWTDAEARLKFFATLQLAYDTTEQHNRALTGYDLAFHNSNGLMWEVMPDLGFYAQLGDTVGFVRWLRFEIDLGVGVQARFP